MSINTNKGKAYQVVMSNLKACNNSKDIFHLIGLIAASESIMSDRLSAFLGGVNNPKFVKINLKGKNVSFGELIEFSKKDLSLKITLKGKDGITLVSSSLFEELNNWKFKRNQIIHALCKSKSTISHKSQKTLLVEAKDSCIEAHRLIRLILKWSRDTKRELKKQVN